MSLLCTTPLLAQGNRKLLHSTEPSEPRSGTVVEDAVSVTWGLDFHTAYFFRGMRRETQGAIAQPHLQMVYGLTEGEPDSGLGNVDLVLGMWNSIHDGPTGTRGGVQAWYESDIYFGAAVSFLDNWSGSFTYSFLSNPNGSWPNSPVEEIAFAIAFDDRHLWSDDGEDGGFALNPSAALVIERKNQADFIVSPAAQEKGAYAQFGVAPQFDLGQTGDFDWTLTTPVNVGLSFGDYYEDPSSGGDKVLGFIELGAEVSTPFPFMPSRFGNWELTGSVSALILGDSTETMNGGDAFELIAGIGFKTTL
ncbi:MAG: hypothetical protein NXI31_18120 [bacterium]|nr:hypothetical protein [bacterium]